MGMYVQSRICSSEFMTATLYGMSLHGISCTVQETAACATIEAPTWVLQGATPLIMACMAGHNSTAQLLLYYGANIHRADANVSFLLQKWRLEADYTANLITAYVLAKAHTSEIDFRRHLAM